MNRMGLFDQPLAIVDIETDGGNYARGHVIEIAVLRVEHGEIVDEFQTLLNPGVSVPYFITNLTGITTHDLQDAPEFDDIAERLLEIMDGAIFVAHNVRFDYSFIKEEFRRIGVGFAPKMLCSVKLSRALYPEERSHKLASLIARHDLQYSARHRAYDDAHAVWQFLKLVDDISEPSVIAAAIGRQLKLPSLPQNLDESIVRALPTSPGVYIFKDESGAVLYVGKSINIRKRVMSHFTRDTAEHKEFKMAQLVHMVEHQTTSGELSALLLESKLVKELQPIYNRRLRRQRQFVVAKAVPDERGYMTLSYHQLGDITPSEYGSIMGVYETRTKAKAAVLTAVRTFDLCPKLCGIEKALGSCFSYQLGKCRGACIGKEPADHYNRRVTLGFERTSIDAWPYDAAVTVSETVDHAEGLVVDEWRIVARFVVKAGETILQPYDAVFDLDAYKILRAFLRDPAQKLSIKPFARSNEGGV